MRRCPARHVRTIISGERSRPRTCSITAPSISAAGTRRTVHGRRVVLQQVGRDVVAIEPPALARVGRRHGAAGRAEDQTLQQGRRLRAGAGGASPRALAQDGVDLVPERLADDRLVLARIGRALVDRLADVHPVPEQLVDVALVDQAPALAADALLPQLPGPAR